MKRLIAWLTLSCAVCRAGTLFCGAYPDWVLVIDEAKGKVTDRIHMVTGLPRSLRLSPDRKTIYVSTNDRNGFETIDVATHKVTNQFVLDTPTHRYRINGGAPDPSNCVSNCFCSCNTARTSGSGRGGLVEAVLGTSPVARLTARIKTQMAAIPIQARRQGQNVSCQNLTTAVERPNADGR